MDLILGHIPDIPSLAWGYSRDVSEVWKVYILLFTLPLALLWRRLSRRVARGWLAVLAVLAVVNYTRLSDRLLFERVDTYDVIHYYLNARYFDELGYYDLYPAIITIDYENGGPHFKRGNTFLDQDDSGHHTQPISVALEKGRKLKRERFTPERWAALSHDFLVLQREMTGLQSKTWEELINDHGFNGTVVWTMVARPIAVLTPVEYVKYIAYVDVLLLGAGLVAVGWAYGSSTALWALLFLAVTYSTRWPTISWAFLRYDYVAALMFGAALLRRVADLQGADLQGAHLQRKAARLYAGAGALIGYAATVRLFPAMWLFGPGMQGIVQLVTKRTLHRAALALLAGFLISVAGLQAAATLQFGGRSVEIHFENMMDHNKSENLSSRRIGLGVAMVYDGELLPKIITQGHKMTMDEQKPLRFLLAALCMGLLGFGLRRRPMDEAYGFGFLPFFLLTTASYYYYVARITLIVLHAGRLEQRRHRVGLAWLLFLEMFSNWAEGQYPKYRFFLIGHLGWGLAIYAFGMALWYVLWPGEEQASKEAVPAKVPEDTPAGAPAT